MITMRIRITLFIMALFSVFLSAHSQDSYRLYDPIPRFVVKTNLLTDLTLSPSLGVEVKLNRRFTLDVPVSYNGFTFGDNMKWKHIAVQPEVRYWLCESFVGHFFGLHGHYANYNVGNISLFQATKDHRYRGWLAGGGFSWGYHWLLSSRFSLETTVGFGYAYLDYSKHEYQECGPKVGDYTKHYFGLTRAGISLIYTLK